MKPPSIISREESLPRRERLLIVKLKSGKKLATDEGAVYDAVLKFNAADIAPMITYGTNPGMGMRITDRIPTVEELKEISEQTFF